MTKAVVNHVTRRLCCLLLLSIFGVMQAQALLIDIAEGQTITLQRVNAEVIVDGFLDEEVWQSLHSYDEFVITEPDTLGQPTHATLVKMFYDESGIYFGIQMNQPVETLLARLSGRDDRQIKRDRVGVVLDTSGEGRYGYWFGMALGDSQMDGTLLPEKQFSSDWDGAWNGATQVVESGWSAEFHIPWGIVSMPKVDGERRIGMSLERAVAYLDERWGWPGLPYTVPKFISAMQSLEVKDVAPRQQYSIFPFTAITSDGIDNEVDYRFGSDFFWRPSTNLQVTATVNPDFGAAESDDVVINLSATETFFPEKRLFFLEGQQIFTASPRADTRSNNVGETGAPYTLVNTRRIGGKPVAPEVGPGSAIRTKDLIQPNDLLGAAKLTGQTGNIRYGVLAAFEDDPRFIVSNGLQNEVVEGSGSRYGIARILIEDDPGGDYRALGLLSTAVLHDDGDAIVHGIDGHYMAASGKLKVDGQLFSSDKDGLERGYGGFVDFEYAYRQGLTQRLGIEYLDDTVDVNDLGYLERNDNFRIRTAHTWSSSNLTWARTNQFDVRGFVQKNGDGLFTGGSFHLSNRSVFDNLTQLVVRFSHFLGSYDDLNSFGNGTYRIEDRSHLSLGWGSDRSKELSFGGSLGYMGEDMGGDSYTYRAYLSWRPDDRLAFDLMLSALDRDGWLLHQDGSYMATFSADQVLPGISLEYFISAKQQLKFVLQWVGIKARGKDYYQIPEMTGDLISVAKPDAANHDFSVSQVSMQARYRWEIAPLSDLYLVYTRQSDMAGLLDDEDFSEIFKRSYRQPVTDALVLKLRYRFGS
ncbi:MAG: hypothetical protein HOL98_03205 [Gammaproteobacteria bacterium]|nr:hypothetical protein [Gammaproteobacteria bacterium]MBT5202442.1 hypothetical protein [Gammaproteobacteria bacterium]MBT6247385.1 hypothetical protein [Gammaproteobacteria bacterium]